MHVPSVTYLHQLHPPMMQPVRPRVTLLLVDDRHALALFGEKHAASGCGWAKDTLFWI